MDVPFVYAPYVFWKMEVYENVTGLARQVTGYRKIRLPIFVQYSRWRQIKRVTVETEYYCSKRTF